MTLPGCEFVHRVDGAAHACNAPLAWHLVYFEKGMPQHVGSGDFCHLHGWSTVEWLMERNCNVAAYPLTDVSATVPPSKDPTTDRALDGTVRTTLEPHRPSSEE